MGSALALAVGAAWPWYTLPPETLAAFGTSLWLPSLMRGVPALAAVIVVLILARGRSSFRARAILWTGLFASFLFPFLVATFSPAVAYVAAAFDLQRDGIAYHIETHFPEIQAQWKQSMRLDPFEEVQPFVWEGLARSYVDPLQTLPTTRPFAIDGGGFFQASSWDRFVLEGLNYLPGFLACAGWGWPITIGALVVALLAVYLTRDSELYSDCSHLWPWFLAGNVLVALIIFVPSFVDRQIAAWQARGEHSKAAAAARCLLSGYSPMQGDTMFLMQKARCDVRMGLSSTAIVNFAKGVDCWKADQLDSARVYFETSLKQENGRFLTRGYLAATLLRLGVQFCEQGQPVAAAEAFEEVLKLFPHHLQATYCLMIARAAQADFGGSAKAADELRDVQQYFRLPSISAIGQSHLHAAWAAFRSGQLNQAWHSYRKSVDRDTWK
jgi:hypothetical protein